MGYINSQDNYKNSNYNWPFIFAISAFLIVAIGMGLMKYLAEHPANQWNSHSELSQSRQSEASVPAVLPVSAPQTPEVSIQQSKVQTAPVTVVQAKEPKQTVHASSEPIVSQPSDTHERPHIEKESADSLSIPSTSSVQESNQASTMNVPTPTKEFYCSTSDEQAGFCQSK